MLLVAGIAQSRRLEMPEAARAPWGIDKLNQSYRQFLR
jgi:hypothetical protein